MTAVYISIGLGLLAVLQAGLNRQISSELGLSTAVLMNTLVLLGVASAFLLITLKWTGHFPEGFAPKGYSPKNWWYVLPGICGFLLVAGMPWAISKTGALYAFLALLVGQMVGSLIWDAWAEGISISFWRVGGATLAIVGLLISKIKS